MKKATTPQFPILAIIGNEFEAIDDEIEFRKVPVTKSGELLYFKGTIIDASYSFFKIKSAKVVSTFKYGGYLGLFRYTGHIVDFEYLQLEPTPFFELKKDFTTKIRKSQTLKKMIGEEEFFRDLDQVEDHKALYNLFCKYHFSRQNHQN